MKALAIAIGALLAMSSLAVAQQPSAARAKMLAAPEDPRQKTILVGRSETNGMIVQFEIEPATAMLISRGARPKLVEHAPAAGELYHLEVKPSDPRSKTRIPYAMISFEETNRDNGKSVKGELHTMWGKSGMHYALNRACRRWNL